MSRLNPSGVRPNAKLPMPQIPSSPAAASPDGGSFSRGGRQLKVAKLADRFTARLRRGRAPADIAASHNLAHLDSLERRQELEVFVVNPAARDLAMEQVRRDPAVEFASHVYQLENDPTSRLYLTDEITVQFAPEAADDEIEQVAVAHGLSLVKPVPGLLRAFVFRLTTAATENPIKLCNRLQATPGILLCEPNVLVASQTFYVPSDSLFAEQWHLSHDGGPFLNAGSHVDAVRAWDITRGVRSVVVAVADDSVDLAHADFQGPGKVVAPRDFAGNDFGPAPELPDDNHGTACAGVAVAEENGTGVVGAAPRCALMPIRTSGYLDDNSIEALFDWVVQNGAGVVSCSWGPAAINFPLSTRQANALHRAATLGRNGLGCVIVFAAGNANRPLDAVVNETGWPNNLFSGPTQWHDGFAAHPDVIAVSACTSLGRKAAYSSWGREISVCAPSNNGHPSAYHPAVGGLRTYPLITGPLPGLGIVTTDRRGAPGYSSSDYTRDFGGTSSACPLVAGVAALTLSANPDLTALEVREILEGTADKITDPATDPQLGLAHGTYDANGHSLWFGHGKVNAFNAVQEAVRRRPTIAATTIRKVSTPGLAIPDNNVTGVRDTVAVAETGVLASARVSVEIIHTYRGDLQLTLLAPSGRSVVLHRPSNDSAENLEGVFDVTSVPGLATLANEPITGNWTLQVQDLAGLDIGRLNRWELELTIASSVAIELTESPGTPIPDNQPAGIERTLSTTAAGTIQSVEVAVDITHTYLRDLRVTLVGPSGRTAALHQREGGSADDIRKTYTPATTPDLSAFRGEPIAGAWKLRIADLEAADVGRLNRWSLRLIPAV